MQWKFPYLPTPLKVFFLAVNTVFLIDVIYSKFWTFIMIHLFEFFVFRGLRQFLIERTSFPGFFSWFLILQTFIWKFQPFLINNYHICIKKSLIIKLSKYLGVLFIAAYTRIFFFHMHFIFYEHVKL